MNILFLCDEYPPCQNGGIGTVTKFLARELVRKGNEVVVCGFYPYFRTALSFENDHGVKVYRCFYGSKLKLKMSKHKYLGKLVNIKNEFPEYLKFLQKIIDENKIEVIEMPDFNDFFRFSGPEFVQFPDFGIPKVVKIHGSDTFFYFINKNSYKKDMQFLKEEKVIRDASVVLAISEFSRTVIKTIFDYKDFIPVIYNGIEDINESGISYKNENSNVIFAGTIVEKKGIYSLVRAWEQVISKVPDAKLFIFGKGSGKSLKKLKRIIPEKVKHSVFLKGFTTKETLQQFYSKSACAIFPSYAESFGMAPIESMQVGCPTIFTKRACGEELIINGITGLLVDPDNLQEIADAIVRLLIDKKYAMEIGKNGAELVKKKFAISSIADMHLDLYRGTIAAFRANKTMNSGKELRTY
jgi:glycogen synthase